MASDKPTSADPEFQAWLRARESHLSSAAGSRSGKIEIRFVRDRSKETFGICAVSPDYNEETSGKVRVALSISRQWLAVEHEVQYMNDVPWSPSHGTVEGKTIMNDKAAAAGEHISRVWFKASLEEKERCIAFVDGALAETERLLQVRLPGFLGKAFEDAVHEQRTSEEAFAGPIRWRRLERKKKRGGQLGNPLTYYLRTHARSIKSDLPVDRIFDESTHPKRMKGRYYAGLKIWNFLTGRRDPATE